MENIDYLFKLSSVKKTLLVIYLVFIMILVVSIVTSVVLHGINPVLFLLTIFDLNSVIQLSRALNNPKQDVNSTEMAYIAINRPSAEFLFAALILYITAIFNQMIAIVAVIRRHLCVLVFTLITNVLILCMSVNFVKTNLFILLMMVILVTIFYTIMLKQIKTNVHNSVNHTSHHQYTAIGNASGQRRSPNANNNNNYSANPVETTVQMYHSGTHLPSTPTDPKILAPIIYCPHYTESVC